MSNVVRTTEGKDVTFPINWSGNSFTVSGQVTDANLNQYQLNIQGQLDAGARKLVTARFELLWKHDTWDKDKQRASRSTRFTLSNLPLTWESLGLMQFEYSAEGAAGLAALSGLHYEYLYESLNQQGEIVESKCTYSSSDYSWGSDMSVMFERK
jgi:hypothetical protein